MALNAAHALTAILLLPYLSMLFVFVLGRRFRMTLIGISSTVIVALALFLNAHVYQNGSVRFQVGGWGAPVGIDLLLDGLSGTMLILTALVGACVSIYGTSYYAKPAEIESSEARFTHVPENFFWPLWFFAWGAMNALFLSADIFNIYVCLEVMIFSAIALITLAPTKKALAAAAKYLFVTLLGSLAYLLGVGLLYSLYGVLDIASLEALLQPGTLSCSAAALMTVGMLIKSALFPMHFWLPDAHANAPSPVSAILSGLIVTAPAYLLVRFWFSLFAELDLERIGQLLGVLGALAIFWGSIQALRQERLKMLIAYSTVAQIGYIFLMFPLTGGQNAGQIFAWNGGILFAVSHGCAKAAAFMAAGTILLQFGHDRISELRGIARSSPMNVFILALAGINLMGMPPSGSFVAKWLLLKAAMLSGQWWYAILIIIGGLLTACYIFKVLEVSLDTAHPAAAPTYRKRMEYGPLVLALISIFLGLAANLPLKILETGRPSSFELPERMET